MKRHFLMLILNPNSSCMLLISKGLGSCLELKHEQKQEHQTEHPNE